MDACQQQHNEPKFWESWLFPTMAGIMNLFTLLPIPPKHYTSASVSLTSQLPTPSEVTVLGKWQLSLNWLHNEDYWCLHRIRINHRSNHWQVHTDLSFYSLLSCQYNSALVSSLIMGDMHTLLATVQEVHSAMGNVKVHTKNECYLLQADGVLHAFLWCDCHNLYCIVNYLPNFVIIQHF